MASEGKKTKDHNTIRAWTEERGGKPSTVKGTAQGEKAGLLRIDFPGRGDDDKLEQISWDDFFRKFDEEDLVFLYQEKTEDGGTSRFNKFIQDRAA